MDYSVIVLAAGKGSRTNLDYNKVFYRFRDGMMLLEKTVNVFLKDEECKQIVVVTTEEEIDIVKESINHPNMTFVFGGETRQDSVYNGLQVVSQAFVMIHDGARCFVSEEEIVRCKQALVHNDACLLMVPVIDTIKQVKDGYVVNTPLRSELYAAQTPQCFKTSLIQSCYEKAKQQGGVASDDASLMEVFSDTKIKVVCGEYSNKKVTTKEDLD